MRLSPVLAALALAGCVQSVGAGPDLGPCADFPDGAYTFGQAGIGTCLSGPSDLRFLELDGRTWLAVANGDPYLNFESGSVLLIDWDSVDPAAPFNRMDQLTAYSVPTARFLGELALVEDRPDGVPLLLVPTRESEGANTISARDDLLIFDVSDPAAPVPWAEGPRLTLQDDPHFVELVGQFAFVFNVTDHSLSMVDTHTTPLSTVDVAGPARFGAISYDDVDDSGSRADLASKAITVPRQVHDDIWSLTWSEGTWRAWVPSADGLVRWQSGGKVVVPATSGPDVPNTGFFAPLTGAYAFQASDAAGNEVPALAFAVDGNLFTATNNGEITSWYTDPSAALLRRDESGGWDGRLDSPSLYSAPEGAALAYDGRTLEGNPASIGVALSEDGTTWIRQPDPVLVPPPGASYEDPLVRSDGFTGGLRMWLSVRDADGWHIAHSESGDAVTWTDPVDVTGLPADVASPVVLRVAGEYRLWCSQWVDGAWWLATGTSADGLDFDGIVALAPYPDAVDPQTPPRPAIQSNAVAGFSVASRDLGPLGPNFARDGAVFDASTSGGIGFRVVTGHQLGGTDLDEDLGSGGLTITSQVQTEEGIWLFGTAQDADGRRRLAVAWPDRREGRVDLLPLDELGLTEAYEPVVLQADGAWEMWFATPDDQGRSVVRRATSPDGLAWSITATVAFDPVVDFARDGAVPNDLQVLADGRLRLWFTGESAGRERIGTALSTDGGLSFVLEPGQTDEGFQLGPGAPGAFDDTSVRDAHVFQAEGSTWLAFSGLDGSSWRIGLARLDATDPEAPGPWLRRADITGALSPWFPQVPGSFAAAGTHHPVPVVDEDGSVSVWMSGDDLSGTTTSRVGLARGSVQSLFPAFEVPTAGDVLTFRTLGGSEGQTVIELQQTVDAFSNTGFGGSNLQYDEERGFLYATSKLYNHVQVIDVRDDGGRGKLDDNYLDLEALLRIRSSNGGWGLRDIVPIPGTDLFYLSGRRPDAVLIIDGSTLVDDSLKQVHENVLLDALPMHTSGEDEGAQTYLVEGTAGAAGMALRDQDGRRHLFVTHFIDNSVSVFDLDRGAFGTQVAYLPWVGEHPHVVRLTPDGRFAVVATLLGDVDDGFVSSKLTVIDADPDSPTFLQIVTTLVNR